MFSFFDDPEHARRYAEGPARFLPGYAMMHRLVIQLLNERVGAKAHVLVLGAGGGLELRAFSAAMPEGADPADVARARTGVETMLPCVSPEREEALLREAGFSGVALFFAGLYWRGWIAHA